VPPEQEFAEIRAMLKTRPLAEKHEAAIANLERQWQAYIS